MRISRVVLLIILFSSCNLVPEAQRVFFDGNSTAVGLRSEAVSNASDLVFEADIALLYGLSRETVLGYIEDQDLKFTGNGTYVVNNLAAEELPQRLPGSTVILVDQSGTYDSADAMNFRSKLINQFTHELGSSSTWLIGGFSKGGSLSVEPAEYGTAMFTSDADAIVPYLFGLAARTGGVSSLYDAMISGIDRLKTTSGSRMLLVLAHESDSLSTATLSDVIAEATLNQIKIDIIFVGNIGDTQPLAKISQQTGGIFSFCPSDLEMITTFNHLNRIYDQPMLSLRMQITFTPLSGPLGSGVDTYHQLTVFDTIAEKDLNPVMIYIRTP